MGTHRYSAEFRVSAVVLARTSDRPLAHVARELDVNPETLRLWVKAADREEPPVPEAADSKDTEISRLRARIRELETEREILRGAARDAPSNR